MASASPSRPTCSKTAASRCGFARKCPSSRREGSDPLQRLRGPGADHPARRDDGRARLRPELHDRRPAAQRQQQHDRPGAGPRQPADPRRPVPLDQLPPRRNRAGDRRHALSGPAGQREPDRAADRRLPRIRTTAERVLLGQEHGSRSGEPRPGPSAAEPRTGAPGRRRPAPRAAAAPAGAGQRAARHGAPRRSRSGRSPASASDDRPSSKGRHDHGSHQDPRRRRRARRSAACRLRRGQPAKLTAVNNPSLYSVHQPVVAAHRLRARPRRRWRPRLATPRSSRLHGWFDSIGLRYGDRISVDEGLWRRQRPRRRRPGRRRIWPAARRRRAGHRRARSRRARSGSSSAAPPRAFRAAPIGRRGQWRRRRAQNTSSNYGCATNSNLAAMIADPERSRPRPGSGSGAARTGLAGRSGSIARRSRPASRALPAATHHGRQSDERAIPCAAPGLRDPFTAFVCDEATAEMLRPIAVEHGWSPEKVNKGGLRNAVQTLSVSASPNILFVDLSELRRSAERHQRARRSLRAGHGGDRRRPGQRRAPLSRSRRQRHPGLSAEAVHAPISCATPSPMPR